MSSTELYERIESGAEDFIVVDVLSPEEYAKEHIPGAINIPLEHLETRAKELNKSHRIIVYGNNHTNESSTAAAGILEEIGYHKVSDFDGGIHAWKRAGYLTSADVLARKAK